MIRTSAPGHGNALLRSAGPVLVALLLAATLLVRTPGRASAFTIWCWDDPVVEINGQRYAILNGVLGEPDEVRRDVQVARTVISVPAGATYRVVSTTHTYFAEQVSFVEAAGLRGRARVETVFQARRDLPASLQVDGEQLDSGSTQGGRLTGGFALSK